MKATGVLLLVAALCAAVSSAQNADNNGSTQSPTIAEAMQVMIDSYRQIMPCGIESLGIPPMAPFRKELITLNINETMFSLTGQITNLVVAGLDDFIIIELSTNGTRTSFDAIYKDIDVLGEFDTQLFENLAGFKYNVKPEGLLNIHFKDVRVSGGMTITKNLFGGLYFSNIDYYVDIGDVVSDVLETQWSIPVNRFFNKYVRETTLLLVEENRDAISQAISNSITPLLNAELLTTSKAKFIQDMVYAAAIYDSFQCNL